MFNYFHINYNVIFVSIKFSFSLALRGLITYRLGCIGCSALEGSSESDNNVEPVDDDVAILHSLAEVLSVSEVEAEEVNGGDNVSNPTTSTLQKLIGKFDGLSEIAESHQGEGGLDQGDGHGENNQSQTDDLVNHNSVSSESAGESLAVCSGSGLGRRHSFIF